MSQAAAPARIFGECREGTALRVQISSPLGWEEQARPCPLACCGGFGFFDIAADLPAKGSFVNHMVFFKGDACAVRQDLHLYAKQAYQVGHG